MMASPAIYLHLHTTDGPPCTPNVCARRALSTTHRHLTHRQLEEGEIDVRQQSFKGCCGKKLKKEGKTAEMLARMRAKRKEDYHEEL
jgi:hypothetical protein